MRKLILTRRKSSVASLLSMAVYAEDPVHGDRQFDDVPCRLIGHVKNGEEKTFYIEESALRIFVVADSLVKGNSSDFYPIPAGTQDVYLSGRTYYNPANGNAFLFDGVTDKAVLDHRKKKVKRGIIILVVATIIGAVIGFTMSYFDKPDPKVFSDSGFEITLNDDFIKVDEDGYDVCYGSEDVTVLVSSENIASSHRVTKDTTLTEYARIIIDNSLFDPEPLIKEKDGLVYLETELPSDDGIMLYFMISFFKTDDSFKMVYISCDSSEINELRTEIHDYARSVKFTD
ncbi:MAG: hypothetical protein IJY56_04760 [Clostridia bacterium]|nr:hypothetical protein [Clostridia bacterium]